MWERVIEKQGRQQQGEAETPPSLLIHQFITLLFNKTIQGGEAQWMCYSCGSIALNPWLVCAVPRTQWTVCRPVCPPFTLRLSPFRPPPHRAASLKCLLLLTDGPQRRLWMLLLLLSDFAAFHQRHTQRNLVWTGGFRVGADLDLCENTKITNIHKSKATTETQQDQSLPNETHLTCVKRHAGSWDKL